MYWYATAPLRNRIFGVAGTSVIDSPHALRMMTSSPLVTLTMTALRPMDAIASSTILVISAACSDFDGDWAPAAVGSSATHPSASAMPVATIPRPLRPFTAPPAVLRPPAIDGPGDDRPRRVIAHRC
jgi:hypothetical protein